MTTCRLPILAAVCCSLLLLALFPAGTESASCCLSYPNKRLKCKDLDHYTLQNINGSCDIKAVIFHGRKPGNFVCADPSTIRTRRLKKCLDDRMRIRDGRHS